MQIKKTLIGFLITLNYCHTQVVPTQPQAYYTVAIIRHGEKHALNLNNGFNDIISPLSSVGWQRACALGAQLSGLPPKNFTQVIEDSELKPCSTSTILKNTNNNLNAPFPILSTSNSGPAQIKEAYLGTICAVFAQGESNCNGYVRTTQTVTPLAQSLGLSLNTSLGMSVSSTETSFPIGKFTPLFTAVKKSAQKNQTVFICWDHQAIKFIIEEFVGSQQITNLKRQDGQSALEILKGWPTTLFDTIWILNFDQNWNILNIQNRGQRLLYGDSEFAMNSTTEPLITYSPSTAATAK